MVLDVRLLVDDTCKFGTCKLILGLGNGGGKIGVILDGIIGALLGELRIPLQFPSLL